MSNLRVALTQSIRVEREIYRHHHFYGALIILGALGLFVCLYMHLDSVFETNGWDHLPNIQLVKLAAWGLVACSLIIGIIMVIRPSILKPLEAVANRWIDPIGTIGRGVLRKTGWSRWVSAFSKSRIDSTHSAA